MDRNGLYARAAALDGGLGSGGHGPGHGCRQLREARELARELRWPALGLGGVDREGAKGHEGGNLWRKGAGANVGTESRTGELEGAGGEEKPGEVCGLSGSLSQSPRSRPHLPRRAYPAAGAPLETLRRRRARVVAAPRGEGHIGDVRRRVGGPEVHAGRRLKGLGHAVPVACKGGGEGGAGRRAGDI